MACKVCQDKGGAFDSGFWYECQACKAAKVKPGPWIARAYPKYPDYDVRKEAVKKSDPVNHPAHYTKHKSGIECIQIVEHMGFNLGNAVKYIWRADLKNDAIEDMKKAIFYLNREIEKRSGPHS